MVPAVIVLAAIAVVLGVLFARQGAKLEALQAERERLDKDIESLRQQSGDLRIRLGIAESEKQAASTALDQRSKELDEVAAKLKQEFENLAHRIFEEKTTKFNAMSQEGLANVLKPLREKFGEFQGQVERLGKDEAALFSDMRAHVEQVVKLNNQLSQDAKNLTVALKGESKTRGNWGELVLERILESSGLREGEEFVREGSGLGLKGEDGNPLKPDVIVNLPDGKHIVVDSKLSLVDYERFSSESEEGARESALKAFLGAIEGHVGDLTGKHYSKLKALKTPEFVLLFMPIEGAFVAAMQADPSLWQDAWQKNIVIVGPSTLLPSLKTFASIWRYERQNKNVQEIARQAGALYDKFVGVLEGIEDAGRKLEQSQKAIADVRNKIKDGKGSLASRVESLKELGAKADKKIPAEYLPEQPEPPALTEKA